MGWKTVNLGWIKSVVRSLEKGLKIAWALAHSFARVKEKQCVIKLGYKIADQP